MEELKERGYVIFRKEIPQEMVEYGKQQINDKVNYYRLKEFIDIDLMKRANKKTPQQRDNGEGEQGKHAHLAQCHKAPSTVRCWLLSTSAT